MYRLSRIARILLPDAMTAFIYLWIAFTIVVLANVPVIITHFGLADAGNHVVVMGAEHLGRVTAWLNGLHVTRIIVTFIVWALVGLATFVVVELLLRTLTDIYSEGVFATKFLLPAGSSRKKYLTHMLLGALEFLAILLMAVLSALLAALLLPTAIRRAADFVQSFDIVHFLLATVWGLLFWLGICALHACLSLMAHRRRVIADLTDTY